MQKFIVIYYAPSDAEEQMKKWDPKQAEEGMKAWFDWKDSCGDGLIDFGSPLGKGQKMTTDGSEPSQINAIGYSILQAEDMEGAKAMLKGHPHLGWMGGCSIEVYEAMPLPGE